MSERDLAKLLALVEKHLGRGWLELSDWLREQNDLGAIEQRIVSGDYAGAVAKLEEAALKYAADIHQSYVQAGRAEAQWLDDKPGMNDKLIRFDETNERAVRAARDNQLRMVQGFTAEQQAITRNILVDGLQRGANPREMARDLRDSIGLTATQEQHVRNYRRALEQGEWTRAMGYELRDGRSDRTMRRLDRDGGSLTPAQVDKLVDKYRQNYIGYRAEVIARTEALRAAHQGTEELHRQAIERGDVEAGQLVREWHTASDGRVRDSHRSMNGQMRRMDEPFVTGAGVKIRFPGDPQAPVSETAQCRCSVSTSFLEIPEGFTAGGAPIHEGVPPRDQIQEGVAYKLDPSALADRIYAPPGGGDDKNRMASIATAWDRGVELEPVSLVVDQDGNLSVIDGRHRLLNAIEQGRDVLAWLDRTSAPAGSGGDVRLVRR